MTFAAPTPELQHAAPDALLEYLRGAILRLAASPSLAQRLGATTVDVQHAIQASFEELCLAESRNGSSSQLKLVFRHDCQNLTCLNPRCPLCCQNPNKRCPDSVHFASKYLEKNPLKSKCGANIRIEVVSAVTGEPAHPQLLQDVHLELSMLDGKKYGSLHETGEDMASCELFLTPKNKELLNPGRMGSHTAEHRVRMPLTPRGQAVLGTDFTVQVSSEAMLGGQKSPYKLLVRAVNQHTGAEVPYITFVASEDFVVATPRVAKAVKAEIPCVDDSISKLEDIGEKTQKKLADIRAAAETCGALDFAFPEKSVITVGQFRQLVEMSNTDPSFNEKLKQYLIPHKAREHVALAVENDKRLRMWYPEPNNIEGGLLYRSVRARVDLDHPDVLVQHKVLSDGSTQPDLTPCAQAQGDKRDQLRRLISKAKEDWKAAEHPNWSIRDMDSTDFLDCHLQPGQTVYASIPENRQLDHTLGFGSGSSGKSQQGSGHLGSGHLGSGHLGSGHHGSGHLGSGQLSGQLGLNLTQGSGQLGSGVLGMNRSQGSGQFAQLVGQGRSGSGVPGWLGSGSGQFGSPHLSGAGQGRAESPFAQHHDQQFQNTGGSHYSPGGQVPSSSGFGGFSPASSTSPFLNFDAQQSSMANIFPGQAAPSQLQPEISQAASSSMGHWGSGSGTASGTLPHQFSDHSRSLQGLQTNLSSQGSPILSTGPFGTHMANSSAGANGNSPALSNNSVPSIAPNGQSFYANPGSVSLVDQLARPSGLDRIDSGSEPGAKRMRAPLQQQSGSNAAYQHPSNEIALQQQLLKQRHSSNISPMLSSPVYGVQGPAGSDPSQLSLHSQSPDSQGMQAAGQQQHQQDGSQQPHAALGNPDLQKNLLSQLQGLPSVDKLLEEPYLLSENSMHFLNPADTPSHDPQSGRPPPNPANSPPQLQNYLANDSRAEPLRNHVRFSPMPSEHDWRAPATSASPRSSSPVRIDLDPSSSNGDLVDNANPNLNGVDPARAKWAQKERWSSGNIFASFGSRIRRQLGESGKSDGLESMRDIQEFLPDLEDMDADHPDVPDL